jgi:arylsulfatase A-like enzyme/cytochrome c-type biogenesis protein CcmH/NrfG
VSRPFRFTFILFLAAVGTGLAAAGGWRYARASAPVSGPIIVISIDTLRADHLPAYGYAKVRTPAIDALAADGVLFERAYSHAPQTLPAHAAVLSGRLPFETGIRDDTGFTVKPGERWLPQMLRDRGYATGGVVSAFLLRKDTGIAQGFDFFDGAMPASPPDTATGELQRDGAASEAVAEKWLASIGSARAFLFLHLYEPHKPYAPPERFSQYAPYDGEIAYADEIVGRLIRYLKSHQLYDRSTIVLLSDHGEGLGDHGEQEHGLFVYDEAIHVPLIIKQESNAGGGRRVTDVVQQIDLVPTILQLAKAPVPGTLRGRSLRPVLDGTGHLPAPAVYSEALYGRYHFGWSELTALTDDRFRYIKAPHDELYDLERDPHERANLAEERAPSRQAMRSVLDRLAPAAQPAGGDALPDPKETHPILETYRAANDLARERKWLQAVGLLQRILREDPAMAEVWAQLAAFAERIDRFDLATDAYKHYIELKPSEPAGLLGAAASLLKQRKLDDARAHAALAADVAADRDLRSRAAAHELLARIALARRDAEGAREEAALAHAADPNLPLPNFIEARLLYDQGKFADALPFFEQALGGQQTLLARLKPSPSSEGAKPSPSSEGAKPSPSSEGAKPSPPSESAKPLPSSENAKPSPSSRSAKPSGERQVIRTPLADLHYYAAETYARLERYPEAEAEFAAELRDFPFNVRARGALAQLYAGTGRAEAAAGVVADMLRIAPTPESYALAARLWTTLGNRKQADAVRAEARRAFDVPRGGSRSTRP